MRRRKRANFCVSKQIYLNGLGKTSTRSPDGQDDLPQPVLGFGKQDARRKHRCLVLGGGAGVGTWESTSVCQMQLSCRNQAAGAYVRVRSAARARAPGPAEGFIENKTPHIERALPWDGGIRRREQGCSEQRECRAAPGGRVSGSSVV